MPRGVRGPGSCSHSLQTSGKKGTERNSLCLEGAVQGKEQPEQSLESEASQKGL